MPTWPVAARAVAAAAFLAVAAQAAAYPPEEVKSLETRITFPAGPVDTLRPALAFIAEPHDAFEAEVHSPDGLLWSSGQVDSRSYTVQLPSLPPAAALRARARVRSGGRWGDWSGWSEFVTPQTPLVRIVRPAHAGRVTGADVELVWETEHAGILDEVVITLDGSRLRGAGGCEPGRQSVRIRLREGLHTVTVKAAAEGRTAESSAEFYVWTAPQAQGELVVLDLRDAASWDVAGDPALASRMYELFHAAACLQGIVNRKGPRLMLRVFEADDFWLDYLRRPGNWLEKVSLVTYGGDGTPEDALLQVATRFAGEVKGLVVWDPAVPATSNVATTAAGVEDLLPVRGSEPEGSLGARLRKLFPVKLELTGLFPLREGGSGSAKCDAYLWAKERYLDSGRADPCRLGYWLDAFWLQRSGTMPWWEHCLTNHDWIVAGRGFLFDLSNWGDEAPQDDPNQPVGADLETFRKLMRSAWERSGGRMMHVAGFTPWAFKYTDHAVPPGRHEPVASEWELVRVLSAYNGYLDADAHSLSAMANASLWSQMPLPDRYVQNPPPTPRRLMEQGYMAADGSLAPLGFTLFYIGDFDSAAWLTRKIPELWADPERGSVPMGWAFNPNLSARNPAALHYAWNSASEADFFTAGDSGAGYVNPTVLLEPRPVSGLPSARAAWVNHCRELYRRYNLRITGFLINGHAGKLTPESEEMTAEFSPDGMATQRAWMDGEGHLRGNTPVAWQMHDLCPDNEANIACMERFRREGLQFLSFRLILLGPSFVRSLMDAAQASSPNAPHAFLDPWTFYYLLRHHLGGKNERRCTFTFDDASAGFEAGRQREVVVGIRNDGWDTWRAGEVHLLCGLADRVDWTRAERLELPHDVRPGEGIVLRVRIMAPAQRGRYVFHLSMADGGGPFVEAGCPWWESEVEVRPAGTKSL
ncbi:MAG: hypothetical protein KatS3mg024_2296 [Armatimonadota bacterium]|nr:MAG: hypothetical protein KatS3mg024_2296 [Armatimonadota bacterium]